MWAAQSYFYISHRHHKQLNTSILDGFVAQFDLLVDVVNADICVRSFPPTPVKSNSSPKNVKCVIIYSTTSIKIHLTLSDIQIKMF